jgi:succinate dehydrogenase / fumarate reductase cytochrome b subunit
VFAVGFGVVPAFVVKLAVLALIWSFLHHISAGLRHLWMDATHSVTKQQGSVSAQATMVISLVLTVALGAKLFNLF